MSEYADMGVFILAIGILLMYIAVFVALMKAIDWLHSYVRVQKAYNLTEYLAIRNLLSKKGIQLEKEVEKLNVYSSKNFKEKIKDEVYEDWFEKEKKK